jgi:hypothetical protein
MGGHRLSSGQGALGLKFRLAKATRIGLIVTVFGKLKAGMPLKKVSTYGGSIMKKLK